MFFSRPFNFLFQRSDSAPMHKNPIRCFLLLGSGRWADAHFRGDPFRCLFFAYPKLGNGRKAGRETHLSVPLSFRFLTVENLPYEYCWGQFHKAIPNDFVGSKNVHLLRYVFHTENWPNIRQRSMEPFLTSAEVTATITRSIQKS